MYVMLQKEDHHLWLPILEQSGWAIIMLYSFSHDARARPHQMLNKPYIPDSYNKFKF